MTQKEIETLLKKYPRWWRVKDIAKKLKINDTNVRRALKSMEKAGELMVSTEREELYGIHWKVWKLKD